MFTFTSVLTNTFINKNIITEDQSEIFVYGLNIAFGKFLCILLLLTTALLSNNIVGTLAFYIGFGTTRKFCGGYHASTHLRCNLLFVTNILLYLFLLKLFSPSLSIVTSICLAYSIILISVFAPIDHPNKPFTKGEYKYFRKCCIILSFIYLLIFVCSFAICKFQFLLFSFSIGTMSAATSMLFAKYLKFKRKDVVHEKEA